MTFNDHLQHLAERALASISSADAGGIYAVSFLWVRPSELATHPRTGKLIEVVDERSRL